MRLRTLVAIFVVAGAWAQPLTRNSFNAKGLNSEEDLNDLFAGNFAALAFDRGSLSFSALFQSYLEAFSSQCSAYLPPNKVEMTAQVCADAPSPPPLPNQPPPIQRGCMSWKTVRLGFAKPPLYAARKQLDADQAMNQFKDMVSMARTLRPAIDSFKAKVDMERLVRMNACNGPGLLRLEENLVLFAKAKPPLVLPGAPPPPSPQSQGTLVDSDFNKLTEDLIADQATAWRVNRYVPGSASQLIVQHDPHGRPSMIRAKYSFTSMLQNGRQQGSVRVSFEEGMPQCIYFSDAPNTCQTPNKRIVYKYSTGGYLDPNAPRDTSPPEPLPPSKDPAVQEKARAEAKLRGNICVPDELLAEWRNPPPGSKMEELKTQLKASLKERATLRGFDQTKWMTVIAAGLPNWNPRAGFRGVVIATDGGSCASGQHEFLDLTP